MSAKQMTKKRLKYLTETYGLFIDYLIQLMMECKLSVEEFTKLTDSL